MGPNSLTKSRDLAFISQRTLIFSFVNLVNIFCPIYHFCLSHFSFLFILPPSCHHQVGHKVFGIVSGAQFPFKNDTASALSKLSRSPKPTVLNSEILIITKINDIKAGNIKAIQWVKVIYLFKKQVEG